MLGATDDQHALGWRPQSVRGQMARRDGAFMGPAAVRLIAQQRVQVAGLRQLAQGGAQLLGLARQRRVVEAQVGHAGGGSLRVRAQEGRPFRFAHEGTAAGLAADQAHGFQFRVHTRGRDQGQPLAGGELSVGGQARARGQAPFADIGGVGVNQLLVASLWHGQMYP